jgi:hypothetical protein
MVTQMMVQAFEQMRNKSEWSLSLCNLSPWGAHAAAMLLHVVPFAIIFTVSCGLMYFLRINNEGDNL